MELPAGKIVSIIRILVNAQSCKTCLGQSERERKKKGRLGDVYLGDRDPPQQGLLHDGAVGPRIRVLIVDDIASVRNALETSLSIHEDIEVVGGAAHGDEAVSLCETLQFDGVVMDLLMPEMDGIETTRIIRERRPQIKVIALTSYEDERQLDGVMEGGRTPQTG